RPGRARTRGRRDRDRARLRSGSPRRAAARDPCRLAGREGLEASLGAGRLQRRSAPPAARDRALSDVCYPRGMLALVTSCWLGFLSGLRHALDPDHLAAVSTLVVEQPTRWRAALLGASWCIGHSASLLGAGALLLVWR